VLLVSINSVVLAERFRRWRPDAFPDPRKDTISCGREGVKSSICDPENILALESANMVDGLINEIAEGKAPFKKAQCDDVGMQGFAVCSVDAATSCMHCCLVSVHQLMDSMHELCMPLDLQLNSISTPCC
jgi:hypothetical protein